MSQKKIIIGTRGSQLSLVQTNIVKDLLQLHVPNTEIEITTITTKGDKNMKPIPLDTIGKGWFTKEIDKQMLDGTIDMAVHSLKDLLDTLTSGLTIAGIPEREDAREALVTTSGKKLKQLKKGAVIGTDSLRRKIQIHQIRPDLEVKSVRGNVNKRLEKLDAGEYDGLFLAVAGLKRLGLEKRITEYFDVKTFIPSPGQGALAVVSSLSNTQLTQTLQKLNHKESVIAVTAERAFSSATGGGCSMPVGAYAACTGKTLKLHGMIGSEDGKRMIKGTMEGSIDDPTGLAEKLATKLLKEAADWYHIKNINTPNYVVTTRSEPDENFDDKAKMLGLETYNLAVTKQVLNLTQKELDANLAKLDSYDWLLFTSSKGVRFFVEALQKAGKDIASLSKLKIATVGPKTAETAKELGLHVVFMPSKFSAQDLAKELPDMKDQTILLPRSAIGNPELKQQLETKGAKVTDLAIYMTETKKLSLDRFWELVEKNQVQYITFTSGSTVKGFMENVGKEKAKVQNIPVCTIGEATTTAAKKYGFTKIVTADTQTTDGIIRKIKESIL